MEHNLILNTIDTRTISMTLPVFALESMTNGFRVAELDANFLYDWRVQKAAKKVFVARDETGPRLALKFINPKEKGEAVQRTVAASELVRQGTSYVPVHGFVQDGAYGIVMEYAPGKTARQLYVHSECTSVIANAITAQLAQNLRHFHEHGFLMGDFNLANMYWDGAQLHLIDPDSVATIDEHNNINFHDYAVCVASYRSSAHKLVHECAEPRKARFGFQSDKESFAHAMLQLNEENNALPTYAQKILCHWASYPKRMRYSLDDLLSAYTL
jgi:tRNA A-37 threonylcarbamoyl transferase component Bud32